VVGRELAQLNNNPTLQLNIADLNIDNEINLYHNITVDSQFYDVEYLCNTFSNNISPLYLNLNVQSLSSKHDKLSSLINELSNRKVLVDVIALQETWKIKYPELLTLAGFQPLIYVNRSRGRGGGVGFYIKEGIQCSVIDTRVSFTDKIFESLTLKLLYPDGKCIIVSSIYRSPTAIPGMSQEEQYTKFK
jgi:hypothetical protein